MVLEGRLSVSADGSTATGEPDDIVYMPKGETVTVRSHADGALTAYVTYPIGARTCVTEPPRNSSTANDAPALAGKMEAQE